MRPSQCTTTAPPGCASRLSLSLFGPTTGEEESAHPGRQTRFSGFMVLTSAEDDNLWLRHSEIFVNSQGRVQGVTANPGDLGMRTASDSGLVSDRTVVGARLQPRSTARPERDSSLDRVSQGPRLAPQRVTHGWPGSTNRRRRRLKSRPTSSPHGCRKLHFVCPGRGGARINDESADVELMVMTEEQYDAYIHKRSASLCMPSILPTTAA